MIYLRKFNESISSAISDDLRMGNYIDQLKDFCESNEDLIEDKLPQDKWFYSLSVKVKIEK